MNAPCRGERKCGTCAFYTDKREEWAAGCKLPVCECRAQDKTFGIANCPNYKSQTYLDTSGHHDIGGYPTGYCEWKCPPILRKVLWGEFGNRLVNEAGSWCHCWHPVKPARVLDDVPLLEQGSINITKTPEPK